MPQAILNFLVATLREYKETDKSNSNKILYSSPTSMISFQHGSNVRLSMRLCMSFSFKVLETWCFMLTAISLRKTIFYAPGSLYVQLAGLLRAHRYKKEDVARPAYPLPLVPESASPDALLSHPYFCPHPQCVEQQVLLHLPVCVDRCQVRTARAPKR